MANEFLSEIDTPDFLQALANTKGVDALAKYCKVDKSNLYKMIAGKVKPSPQLCDALGIEKATFYILPDNLATWWEGHQNATQSKESSVE